MSDNHETISERLPSGVIVKMSADVCHNCFDSFFESQFLSFNHFINAGLYFPQIMTFLATLFFILVGEMSYSRIIIAFIANGIFFTIAWLLQRCYKVPGLAFISCLVGGNFFRYFLHYVVFAIIAFVVCHDWKVLLFCIIGSMVSTFIRSALLFPCFNRVKYNDEIAKYVAGFKYKK